MHEAKARRGLGRRPHPLYPLVILTVAVILSSCSEGNRAADLPHPSGGEMEDVPRPSPSEATTARFEVMLPLSEDGQPAHDALLKGPGDFATGELAYTSFLGGKPYQEHFDSGTTINYERYVVSPVWNKTARDARSTAVFTIRNRLVATTDPLGYLKSIADEVVEVGTETVRAVTTTHYRASGDLGRPETEDHLPVDVWIDENGRTRRFLYRNLELGKEHVYVSEFYDFGVSVDHLEPPPPDNVIDLVDREAGS